jgi:hypothetical protein
MKTISNQETKSRKSRQAVPNARPFEYASITLEQFWPPNAVRHQTVFVHHPARCLLPSIVIIGPLSLLLTAAASLTTTLTTTLSARGEADAC